MRLYGALIYTDFLLLESIRAVQAQILSEYNPKPCDNTRLKEIRSIRVRLTSEFFRTLIYRIDAGIISCWGISSAVQAQAKIRKKNKTKYI